RGYELRRALRARLGMAHAVNGTRLIAPQRFSIVVGAIYDCAIDPERWPEVLHEICVDLKCMLAAIYLVDLQRSHIRVSKTWNGNDEQTVREYSDDLMYYLRLWPLDTQPLDEPMAASREMDFTAIKKTKYAQEVGDPRGVGDSISALVVRNFPQVGMFSATLHKNNGLITDDDLALTRLFMPHIRRAVTISDLLELK